MQTLKEAVDAPRFHNQFLPHTTEYERSIPGVIGAPNTNIMSNALQEIINQLINAKGQRNMTGYSFLLHAIFKVLTMLFFELPF